ncbi:MAG: Rrf2 family transcriptional regulator [Candidatus Omnitrophica bacterium]|nr:Rrf2 family transcriptional regulator [Candidatus Omnitrophota bacterium]MDE2009842.1 Rrf2 family transcriptional regulator [Candidatus Omnitrophota bacterium]MDE2214377.1 Rrf2 family transcriptional regulator [Candidatus Omnitrophota bacterium]MDE2231126.1 Rrf2 family transcriptional regulator [Candidatus Omnitrophota bacterium]
MKLTNFCDYSLRVLIYLGIKNEKSSIGEIAQAYGISRNHVVKIVHNLAKLGYIQSIQGKNGGIKLGRIPKDINLGRVVEQVEPDFNLVECFAEKKNNCRISPVCRLKGLLKLAQKEFLNTLKSHNLADIIENKSSLLPLVSRPNNR